MLFTAKFGFQNKRARQAEREKLREVLGDAAPEKEVPKTIESTREYDETMVQDNDDEVFYLNYVRLLLRFLDDFECIFFWKSLDVTVSSCPNINSSIE